ncbi:unnamed protein product [Discosporangium mesarthrocarpum]
MSATIYGRGGFPVRKRRSGEEVSTSTGLKKHRNVEDTHVSKPTVQERASPSEEVAEESQYVQRAIHKEVQYEREGEGGKKPKNLIRVFHFVKENFVIPADFEKNHKYGPLSGISHEKRVVRSYMDGLLKAMDPSKRGVKMCLKCGKQGHFPRYCPEAFSHR